MLGFPLGILSSAGSLAEGDFELIETQVLASAVSSITFASLATYASVYDHLQLRLATRTAAAGLQSTISIRLNGDTGSNYSNHGVGGGGSSVFSYSAPSNLMLLGSHPATTATANAFGAAVIDLLDAFSTTKNKTVRSLAGDTITPQIALRSSARFNTESTTSITVLDSSGSNLVIGSRFSLYGIKG